VIRFVSFRFLTLEPYIYLLSFFLNFCRFLKWLYVGSTIGNFFFELCRPQYNDKSSGRRKLILFFTDNMTWNVFFRKYGYQNQYWYILTRIHRFSFHGRMECSSIPWTTKRSSSKKVKRYNLSNSVNTHWTRPHGRDDKLLSNIQNIKISCSISICKSNWKPKSNWISEKKGWFYIFFSRFSTKTVEKTFFYLI
jgi:hypothetical protein